MPRVMPSLLPFASALLVLTSPLAAQSVETRASSGVPSEMLPPAGKCRIWVEGVPPGQQPASTDCATALRQKPANGVILYGPPQKGSSGGRFDPSVGEEPRTRSERSAPAQGRTAAPTPATPRKADPPVKRTPEPAKKKPERP